MYYANAEGAPADLVGHSRTASDRVTAAALLNMAMAEEKGWDSLYAGDGRRASSSQMAMSNKVFDCPRCRSASFASVDNLKTHMLQYCDKRMAMERKAVPSSTPSADVSTMAPLDASTVWRSALHNLAQEQQQQSIDHSTRTATLNALLSVIQQQTRQQQQAAAARVPTAPPTMQSTSTIDNMTPVFVPMAYTPVGVTSVQIIGPPQCVVPVAVPRQEGEWRKALPPIAFAIHEQAHTSLPPARHVTLALNDELTWKVHTSSGTRRSAHCTPPRPSSCGLRALDLRSRKRMLSVTPLVRVSPDVETQARTLVHTVSPMHTGTITPRIVTRSPLVLGASAKPFACECGVRFSNEVTLRGHKQFYCSGAPGLPREGEENASPPAAKKAAVVVDELVANSFVLTCKQCGVKTPSIVAMRAHIRTHMSANSTTDVDTLLAHLVTYTSNALPPPAMLCPHCMQAFPNMTLYNAHDCRPVGEHAARRRSTKSASVSIRAVGLTSHEQTEPIAGADESTETGLIDVTR